MLTIRVIWTTFLSFSILFALFVHIELLQENKNMKVSTYLYDIQKQVLKYNFCKKITGNMYLKKINAIIPSQPMFVMLTFEKL
jgi:virulence-associated protein VapD